MDVFLGKDSVGLMRYRRPKFFAQANGFYLWIFLVSALVVGVGKLVLEVRSTWALFHQPPGSAATVLSPGGTAANDAGDRLTAPPKLRKWTACAFTVFDFSMFLVVVIFGGRFMRDWNDTRRLVFPDST